MQIYIIKENNHLNYINVEVMQETKTRYKTYLGWVNKSDAYFREVDVINAMIATDSYYINLLETRIERHKKQIKMLIERKHNMEK